MTGRSGAGRSAIWSGAKRASSKRCRPSIRKTGMLPRMWTAKIGAGYAGPAVADGRVFVTDRIAERESRARAVLRCGNRQGALEAPVRGTLHDQLPARPAGNADGRRQPRLHASAPSAICFASTPPAATSSGKNICRPISARSCPPGAWPPRRSSTAISSSCWPAASRTRWSSASTRTPATKRWRALDGKEPGYCPPVILEFGGQRQLIIWHPAAVVGLESGEWQSAVGRSRSPSRPGSRFPRRENSATACSSPASTTAR